VILALGWKGTQDSACLQALGSKEPKRWFVPVHLIDSFWYQCFKPCLVLPSVFKAERAALIKAGNTGGLLFAISLSMPPIIASEKHENHKEKIGRNASMQAISAQALAGIR